MRMPRVSIAMLMAAVAIVAADCALVSKGLGIDDGEAALFFAIYFLSSLPTVSVWLFILATIVGSLRRSGEAGPFSLGFVVAGTGALGLTVLVFAIAPDPFFNPLERAMFDAGRPMHLPSSMPLLIVIIVSAWTPLQLLLAWLGGRLARRIGLKLVIEPRRPVADPPAGIPPAAVPETVPAA